MLCERNIWTNLFFQMLKSDETNPPPPTCGDGNCISPSTGNLYQLGEVCVPDIFNKVIISKHIICASRLLNTEEMSDLQKLSIDSMPVYYVWKVCSGFLATVVQLICILLGNELCHCFWRDGTCRYKSGSFYYNLTITNISSFDLGVFATWYWTWEKSQVPCCILGQSMGIAIIFHLVSRINISNTNTWKITYFPICRGQLLLVLLLLQLSSLSEQFFLT